MLLDTPSLYFRAFFGVPESVTASDGTPVNAIRGLLDMIARLVRDRSPHSVVACMDADWRPQFRVDALPSYKAHRVGPDGGDQTPPALGAQVPVIGEVLAAFGIAQVGAPGYEADDVIGTLAVGEDGEVDVVTGDRDLFQLVRDDKPVRVLYTDGLIERRERSLQDGLDLLVHAASTSPSCDPDGVLDHVLEVFGAPNPNDDTCVVAIQIE